MFNKLQALTSTGLRENDPRLRECMQGFSRYQSSRKWEDPEFIRFNVALDREDFKE